MFKDLALHQCGFQRVKRGLVHELSALGSNARVCEIHKRQEHGCSDMVPPYVGQHSISGEWFTR